MARRVTWLCDTNVWLALALSHHRHHGAAARWFDAVTERDAVIFCRATQQSLLRLLTSAAVFAPYGNTPLTNAQAWDAYEAFTADDRIVFRAEPSGVGTGWSQSACRDAASPKLWMDAYLESFARVGGHTLVTTDAAFTQFADLDPLVLSS